jgi:hypothetical protein
MTSAYELPFSIRHSSGPLLSSGGPVEAVAIGQSESDTTLPGKIFGLFAGLAATGALAGTNIEPWNSGIQIKGTPHNARFELTNCRVDEQALIVLVHLLFARQEELLLRSVEVSLQGKSATQRLECDQTTLSWYPDCYRSLPFALIDEEPEGDTYTFVTELRKPLQASHGEHLENALDLWTKAILAGGYGLAPIPPQESYLEPESEHVTAFDTTVEWTIFKLRADPACIHSLINIFAAFHHRCQEVVSLTIS